MGLRFRKSKNIGGGFRLNYSKSGVGGSWGIKGFRITKKAKGGLRMTTSIPGTGISHTTDTKGLSSGCLKVCVEWPIMLILWMLYGIVWLMFVLPFKLITKLFKGISKNRENMPNNVESNNDDTTESSDQIDMINNAKNSELSQVTNNSCILELILCISLGWIGIHKFYKKKIGMGILYVITFGLFGIGWIIDSVVLIANLIKK